MLYPLSEHPRLAQLIRAAAPSYRKKNAGVDTFPVIEMHDTYWSGGSRSSYTWVDLETLQPVPLPHYDPPQFGGAMPSLTMTPGRAMVKTGIFLGKPGLAFVTLHPSDLQRVMG